MPGFEDGGVVLYCVRRRLAMLLGPKGAHLLDSSRDVAHSKGNNRLLTSSVRIDAVISTVGHDATVISCGALVALA